MTENLLKESPIHLLHRAGQCASDLFSEEVSIDALTPRQFAVLFAVSQNEGLNQTHLVQETGIDRSTLADIVQRMLKKGLLRRVRMEKDARAYAVYLTEEGKAALKQAEPAVSNVEQKLLNALPEEKRAEFIAALSKIVEITEKSTSTPHKTVTSSLSVHSNNAYVSPSHTTGSTQVGDVAAYTKSA